MRSRKPSPLASRSKRFAQVVRRMRCYGATICVGLLCDGCRGGERIYSSYSGTIVIATTGDAETLFPPLMMTAMDRQVSEQIFDCLASVGPEMNTIGDKGFRPQLAESWTWSADSLSIAFHLHPDARWHDGVTVTSEDVRFSFTIHSDSRVGSTAAAQLTNIDSVTAPSPSRAVFWFKKRNPLQFFDATNQMLIIPKHVYGRAVPKEFRERGLDAFPVGSGRFRLASWNRGEWIELTADSSNYRGSPGFGRLIWRITPSAVSATTMLFAGDADVYDTMRPENVREAGSHKNVRVVSAPGTAYAFMQFNFRDPDQPDRNHLLFSSRDVRRALTMAVDRQSMVRNVFDSLARVGLGPAIRAYPNTDTTLQQLHYDTAAAGRLLDREGWLRTADGSRRKDGRRLEFTLLVPASSTNRQRMATLLQEQLRRAGVRVLLDEVEWATFSARLREGQFDAALGSVQMGSTPSAVREAWGSSAARAKGGANYGTYSSGRFDVLVDSANQAMDPSEARRLYNAAYQVAIDDAPAIWLYEPKLVMGIHRRIRTTPFRPDAWWSSIADWHIPVEEQINRDRVTARPRKR